MVSNCLLIDTYYLCSRYPYFCARLIFGRIGGTLMGGSLWYLTVC